MRIKVTKLPHKIWVIVVLATFGLGSCEGQKQIVQSLTESEANEILVVLDSQKIPANKLEIPGREITFAITVADSQSAPALKLLVNNKLPRSRQRGFAQIYPQGKGGLIPTRHEEKARFLMGSQGEIENMLEILPGVVKAKVVIVLPDTSIIRDLNSNQPKATASVALVYNAPPEGKAPLFSKSEIQQLVASAVEDLSPSEVSVVLTTNQPLMLVDVAQKKKRRVMPVTTEISIKASDLEKALSSSLAPELKKDFSRYFNQQAERRHKQQILVWIFAFLALSGLTLGALSGLRLRRYRKSLEQPVTISE